MLYYTCPRCGANLDPWEKCDCEADEEQASIVNIPVCKSALDGAGSPVPGGGGLPPE